MLMKARLLKGFQLDSLNGEIGKVKDFYFDDHYWTIRYLIAQTGNWLTGKKVLISPYALGKVTSFDENISVNLSREQIENSPSLDSDKPVSRQFEESYYEFYGWPTYWSGAYMWGAYPYLVREPIEANRIVPSSQNWDHHLRSINDVDGHHLEATDGVIGHVEDFLIDVDTWAIRYLVINTQNWWPGKRVLIAPQWIERVSWEEKMVYVNLNRESIKSALEYNEASEISRDEEADLYRHYGRAPYWLNDRDFEVNSRNVDDELGLY